jgi:hypothetical protein
MSNDFSGRPGVLTVTAVTGVKTSSPLATAGMHVQETVKAAVPAVAI